MAVKYMNKKDLPKCRVNSCFQRGDFERGICPKCKNKINKAAKAKRKPIKKESSNTYSKALREAKQSFQRLRRIEEADDNGMVLCECGAKRHWTNVDGGHFLPAERLATCFIPENVNPQTKLRNMKMYDPIVNDGYRHFMIKKYGAEKVAFLELHAHSSVKYSTWELVQMKAEYDRLFEVELKRLKK
jgi:hypothetical protein